MHYEFDPVKDDSNFSKHGLRLSEVDDFDWETALILEDRRQAYTEPRFEAKGYVGERLCVMVFCLRASAVRVISLRKANLREVKSYAKT
ncbi:MAG: hypothetical protein RL406_663 [Pseudomonadota bacterium]|jgi:uncharacterized DUF497 family protein